jgi:mRNA interferase RelE/StbE
MGVAFTTLLTDDSREDFEALDGSQKPQVLKSLAKIESVGMQAGQPLHGLLHDCRKLKHLRLGLRVVFRQSNLGIEIVEIVAIGKRSENEIYEVALRRLGRA